MIIYIYNDAIQPFYNTFSLSCSHYVSVLIEVVRILSSFYRLVYTKYTDWKSLTNPVTDSGYLCSRRRCTSQNTGGYSRYTQQYNQYIGSMWDGVGWWYSVACLDHCLPWTGMSSLREMPIMVTLTDSDWAVPRIYPGDQLNESLPRSPSASSAAADAAIATGVGIAQPVVEYQLP